MSSHHIQKTKAVKKEIYEEIRNFRDKNYRKKVEEGPLGEVEDRWACILSLIVKGFEILEDRIDSISETTYAQAMAALAKNTATTLEASNVVREFDVRFKTEVERLRAETKETKVRLIEDLSRNFEKSLDAINSLYLPLERIISDSMKDVKNNVGEIWKQVKDIQAGLREFRETLDIEQREVSELNKNLQSRIGNVSRYIDDRLANLEEKLVRLEEKFGKLAPLVVEMAKGEKLADMEEKLGRLETIALNIKNDERLVGIEEKVTKLETVALEVMKDEMFANIEEKTKKLEEASSEIRKIAENNAIQEKAIEERISSLVSGIESVMRTSLEKKELEEKLMDMSLHLDMIAKNIERQIESLNRGRAEEIRNMKESLMIEIYEIKRELEEFRRAGT